VRLESVDKQEFKVRLVFRVFKERPASRVIREFRAKLVSRVRPVPKDEQAFRERLESREELELRGLQESRVRPE
jgi:hypothetical protein